jgi:hypothetical protein
MYKNKFELHGILKSTYRGKGDNKEHDRMRRIGRALLQRPFK